MKINLLVLIIYNFTDKDFAFDNVSKYRNHMRLKEYFNKNPASFLVRKFYCDSLRTLYLTWKIKDFTFVSIKLNTEVCYFYYH